MKHLLLKAIGVSALILPLATTFAAGTLTNGGLGQSAADTANFGVAVCNQGASAVTDVVPLTVTANGITAEAESLAPLNANSCGYTYLSYDQFNMQAGQTYDVSVAIQDGAPDSYSITAPGAASDAAQSDAAQQTATVTTQSGNVFSNIWNWFIHLF